MATSRHHGVTSSALTEPIQKLQALCADKIISSITKALGGSSDLHLVGGAVRDIFDGKVPKDIDLATVLRPEIVSKLLSENSIHWIPTGMEHGTILAVIDQQHIEITTFRQPGPRLPESTADQYSSSIDTDLQGRDFTINAVAYSVTTNKLIDPFDGTSDIRNRILRAVGDPVKRFSEDPLRLLRMIRFGPSQNRTVEESTLIAATSLSKQILKVSPERIRDEFSKIITSKSPADALRMMRQLGLLDIIVPEVTPSYDFEQNEYHRFDVFEHTLAVIENSEPSELQRLAALFHDLGKPHTLSVDDDGSRHFYKHELLSTTIAKDALRRMRYSNQTTSDVSELVRHHMRPIGCGPAGIRRLIRDLGPLLDEWLKFKEADSLGAKVKPMDFAKERERFVKLLEQEKKRTSEFLRLAINGDEIKSMGYTEGPKIGQIIKFLGEEVLNDPSLNTKDSLIKLINENFPK